MRKVVYIILVALATMMAGCRKSHFKLELSLNPDIWGNYHMEYYAQGPDGGGKWITQTLPLDRGKFSMQGVTLGPTLANISMTGSRGIFIWIEPGNEIKISGDASDPATWDVEGNDINRQWNAFRRESAKQPDSLQRDVVRYIEKNPDSRLRYLSPLSGWNL